MTRKGSALDAIESAVCILENNSLFNAGKGSVFTNKGEHMMDASIMDGKTLKAGCVSSVRNIKNPVLLARTIMDKSEFVYMSGEGAEEFARLMNIKFESDEYFFDQFRYNQYLKALEEDKVQLDHSKEQTEQKNPEQSVQSH